MHRVTKKLVPAILIAAMLFTTSLPAAFAAYVPPVQSSSELYLTADGGQNTINITAVGEPGGPDDPEPPSAIYGDLALSSAGPSYLSRDYAQSVRVKVENKTADAIQYYLSAENPYEDIYLNFVKAGSIDEPLTILPYEAQEVELSIFLQDARRPRYSIPVSAFVVIGGRAGAAAESLYNLNFYCNLPNFSVDFTKGGINGASLATEYTIRNTSGTKITDLTLSLGGEAADYVRIEPAVESYEIVPNYAVTVKLIPDLKKIKANNKTLVTGTLIAEGGGGSSNEEISFDTEGKGITVGTIGELGLMQDENPYHDIDMDEGTASFVTSISATGVDFADITARYYEEGNPAKDGVNTADEFYEVVGEIIDPDTGMFDFTMYDAFTYDDGTKSVPVSVRFHTELVPDSSARAMAAGDADTGVVTETYYKDGTLTTKQGAYLSVGDYRSIVNGIAGAGEYLKIVNLDRDIFGSADPGIGQKVFFQIDTSLSGMDLDFMGAYAGPSGLVDFSGVNDIDAFSGSYSKVAQISDSFAFKGVEALGTAADIIEAGESIYKTANVWANPNPSITTEQRVGYTGLQIAKNVNSFVGGTLLAKAGTAIGTAIGDGPGAIIGFFTGYVVSGLLGLVLDHYIDEMDASFGGNSLFANIFGKQCTNRGRVDANFYLPDYGVPADAYITGRMYGGGYVNRTETNYDNYLNGEKIGTSRNSGLTEVVINSLPADKLRPGKKNTVTRDYDTDPGSHSVVADTEIAIIYPPGTEIAYIGDTPASMEEVRLLPDLAVYAENIYLKDEAIIGEPNKVIFNVYNRGSLGAWVEIGASDHTGALYTDSVANGGEYRYIGAFSSAEISFAWTPAQERTDVTVVLENKTVGVHERRADNNSATHTFEARGRAVPEIGAISPAEVALQDSDAGMNLSADLTRADDVVSAYFTLDGAAARYEAAFARNGRALRASAFVPAAALPEGDHTARLVVTYKTGIDGTASKSADGNVKVTKVQDLVFAIDTATIAKPVFQVWELRSYMYLPVSAAITVDGGAPGRYRLAQTKEMYANPDDYYLFVKCDAGILIKKISQLSSPLSLAEPYTLSVDKGEADKISRITIKSLDGRSLPSYAVFTDKESVLLSYDAAPGAQAVPIKFEVGYMASTISDYTEIEGGLAGGGLGVNLDDYVAIYRFGLGQAPADSSFGGYFTTEYAGSKDDYSTRAVYDADKKQLVAMSENWNYEYIERAETLGFIVAIGDTLYIADLTDYSAPIDLDAEKAGYAKITYALDGAGALAVQATGISYPRIDWTDFRLDGDVFYVPAGTYGISTDYAVDGVKLYAREEIAVSGDTTVRLPNTQAAGFGTISFSWADMFSAANVTYTLLDGRSSASVAVEKAQRIAVPAGSQTVDVSMLVGAYGQAEYAHVGVAAPVTVVEGSNVEVALGNAYRGKASTDDPFGGGGDDPVTAGGDGYSSLKLYVSDFADANGVRFKEYYDYRGNRPLSGKVVLVNKADAADFHEVPIAGRDGSMSTAYGPEVVSFTLPNVTGEYYYTVELSTKAPDCTVSFESNGGSAVSAIKVAKGERAEKPKDPVKAGFRFAGWFADAGLSRVFDFTAPINESMTLYAGWTIIVIDGNGSLGGGGGGGGSVAYAPKVVSNDGGKVTVSPDGKTLTITPDEGYIIKDVIINGKSVGAVASYTFENASSANEVEVVFEKADGSSDTGFPDVARTDWYYDAVKYVTDNKLFEGTGKGFEPNLPMTRAMLVTVLYRYMKQPSVAGDNAFSDVGSDAWYTAAVEWASENGLVMGYSANTFAPGDEITREQIAAILYRFAQKYEIDTSKSAELAKYSDAGQISDYALPALKWANAEGLILGRTDSEIAPKGFATRAEVATILMRFIENVANTESDEAE